MSLIKKMLYQYFDPFCPDRDSFPREKTYKELHSTKNLKKI